MKMKMEKMKPQMNKVSDDEDLSRAEAEETMPTPTSDERSPVDQDIQDEINRSGFKNNYRRS